MFVPWVHARTRGRDAQRGQFFPALQGAPRETPNTYTWPMAAPDEPAPTDVTRSTPDTRRAKELFFEAVELPDKERRAFLDQIRSLDESLYGRVTELLAAHKDASGSSLDVLQRRFRTLLGGLVRNAADSRDEPSEAAPRMGDYELLGEIASGSAGVVYRARQRSLDRIVALKLLRAGRFASEREVERFRSEAEAVARLDHPRIVPVYEVGAYEGRHYFSMKLIEGGSLGDHIDDLRRDQRRAAEILVEVARAVHHGHQRGLLHRDLKPSNILIDEEGVPYVADFGIAKSLDQEAEVAYATGTEWFAGTPAYMAPEQATRGDLTVATDVYSLGCVLYELLAGRPPFDAHSLPELLARVRDEPPPPVPSEARAPRDLETIARKCLDKMPSRRYASASALADDLKRWLAHEPILARRTGPVRRALLFARRRPLVAGLGGAGLGAHHDAGHRRDLGQLSSASAPG